jgi:hypothetical protein
MVRLESSASERAPLQESFTIFDSHGWELDPAVVMVARQFFNLSELEGGISRQRKRVSAFGAINRECNEDDDDDAGNCEENGSLNSGTVQTSHLNVLQHLCFPDVAIGNCLSLLKLDHEINCILVLYTS